MVYEFCVLYNCDGGSLADACFRIDFSTRRVSEVLEIPTTDLSTVMKRSLSVTCELKFEDIFAP